MSTPFRRGGKLASRLLVDRLGDGSPPVRRMSCSSTIIRNRAGGNCDTPWKSMLEIDETSCYFTPPAGSPFSTSLATAFSRVKLLEEQNEQKEDKIQELTQERDNNRKEVEELKETLDIYRLNQADLRETLADRDEKLVAALQQVEENQQQLRWMKSRLEEFATYWEARSFTVENERDSAIDRIEKLEQALRDEKERVAVLEEKRRMWAETEEAWCPCNDASSKSHLGESLQDSLLEVEMEKLSDLLEDSQVELERVRKRADKLDYQNKRLRAQLDLIEKQHRSSTQERLQELEKSSCLVEEIRSELEHSRREEGRLKSENGSLQVQLEVLDKQRRVKDQEHYEEMVKLSALVGELRVESDLNRERANSLSSQCEFLQNELEEAKKQRLLSDQLHNEVENLSRQVIQLGVELEAGKRMEEEMLFNNRRLEVELDECRHQLHLGGQKHEEEVRHISKLLEDSKIKLQNERDRINGMDAHNAELLAELEELRLNEIQRSGEVEMLFGLLEELRADLEVDRKRVEVPDGCSEVSLVEAEGSPRHLILTPPKKEVKKMSHILEQSWVELDGARGRIKELELRNSILQADLEGVVKQHRANEQRRDEEVGKLSILLEESCREVERFRIQAEKLEVENSHLRTQLDVSEKQLSASLQLCEQAKETSLMLEEARAELERVSARMQELSMENDRLRSEMDVTELQQKTDALERRKEVVAQTTRADMAMGQLKVAQAKLIDIELELKQAKFELEAEKTNSDRIVLFEAEVAALQLKYSQAEEERARLQDAVTFYRTELSQLEQAHKEVVEQVSALRVEKTALLADKRRRDVEQAHLVAHLKTEKTRTIQGSARLARALHGGSTSALEQGGGTVADLLLKARSSPSRADNPRIRRTDVKPVRSYP